MSTPFLLEGTIQTRMRELNCADDHLVSIAQLLGVKISKGMFSGAMLGKRPLDHDMGQALLDVLQRMAILQSAVRVPINWRRSVEVTDAMIAREIAQISTTELHIQDSVLENAAARLTERMQNSSGAPTNGR